MFGLGDMQIAAALTGCLGITLFAVVSGAINWTRGSDPRMDGARIRGRRGGGAGRRRPAEERR